MDSTNIAFEKRQLKYEHASQALKQAKPSDQ